MTHSTKITLGALVFLGLMAAAFSLGQFSKPLDAALARAMIPSHSQANSVGALPIRPHLTEAQLWLAAEKADALCTAMGQAQAKGEIKLNPDLQARVSLLSKNLRNVEKSSGFSLSTRDSGGGGGKMHCTCMWDYDSGVLIISQTCPVHSREF